MESLPPEILRKIFGHFSIVELEHAISDVSTVWKEIATTNISRRIRNFEDDLPNPMKIIIRTYFTTDESGISNELIARKYETLFFQGKFEMLELKVVDLKLNDIIRPVLRCIVIPQSDSDGYESSDSEESNHEEDETQTMDYGCIYAEDINQSLRFMPCYELVVFLKKDSTFNSSKFISMMHQNDLFKLNNADEQTGRVVKHESSFSILNQPVPLLNGHEYFVEGIFRTITNFEVYHDTIIIQQTGFPDYPNRRNPSLYKVCSVNHDTKRVKVELIASIFFPWVVDSFKVYDKRVISMFPLGNVGVWKQSSDDVELKLSRGNLFSTNQYVQTEMFQISNLIIFKTSKRVKQSGCCCYEVDLTFRVLNVLKDGEDLEVIEVPMLELLQSCFPDVGTFKSIWNIQISGNMLFFLTKVCQNDNYLAILCVLKLKKFPKESDFLCFENFSDLVDIKESETYLMPETTMTFMLIPPGSVPSRDAKYLKASILLFEFVNNYDLYKIQIMDIISKGTSTLMDYQGDSISSNLVPPLGNEVE